MRFPGIVEDDDDIKKNYQPKEDSFRRSINSFRNGQIERTQNRNPELNIPNTIDHIVLQFHDYFDSGKFENVYRSQFGLSAIAFEAYHTKAIFAIVDQVLFENFKKSIISFISDSSNKQAYSSLIKYIVDFNYYGTPQLKRYEKIKAQVVVNLMDSIELYEKQIVPITDSLLTYCKVRNLEHRFDGDTNKLELFKVKENTLQAIADNFDVIHTINSYNSAIIKPSEFNLKEISYGFEISNAEDDLPLIGIIDSGIEKNTPLSTLILNSNTEFDLTNTGSHSETIDHCSG